MKNKFLSGFLSGLAGALIIFTIALTIYVVGPDRKDDNAGLNKINNAEAAAKKTEDEEHNEKIMKKVKKIEALIDHYYFENVDEEAFADGIYKGILQSLGDPYSTYYTKAEYKSLMESSSGIYCGIGATVTQDVTTGIISIVTPFVTGPAYEIGLLPGDIIYKVEGKEVTGFDLTEVVSRIKGEEGTKVEVSIIREGESEPLDFSIPRRVVEVPTISYEMLDGKIGYITISEFDEVTAQQFRDAIAELDKQGQKGLIIDIRNNPGGLLNTVSDMLDRMLPKGLIVYTKDKYGNREEKKSDGKEEFSKPLAVIINGRSASASEIFAGAIQDYGKGTIVGTTSFGKGIVQSIIPLQDGTAIKVTVSKYFTPKGQDIHGIGIKPDVTVELKDELKKKVVIKKEEDNQLQKAIEIIKKEIDK
ncbi:S41 family peptidase [Anaerocolumna sp.]|uniref:S41 family peptidase n=1 Tax=Anaerocolumna sp. TaxID=2041569 RepID=UPI0028AD57C3|nr:S41 family peptidase [Anaerocolumna sp.]